MDQIRRRGDARRAPRVQERRLINITPLHLAVLARTTDARLAGRAMAALRRQPALLARDRLGLRVRVVRELQPLDGRGALLADVADDVRDGVGLVAEVAVRDVDDGHVAQALAVARAGGGGVVEARLHFWGHVGAAGEGARGGARVGRGGGGVCRCFRGGVAGSAALLGDVLEVLVVVAVLNVLCQLVLAESADNMLHMVSLAADERAQVKNNALCLVALAQDGGVGVLELGELLLVALALALEFLGDLLLQDESLEGVVALLLGAGEADGEAGAVVLVLLDEGGEAAGFALVGLDLGFEVGGLLGELFGKGLEFEELLLPALELLDEEVVPLGNLAKLRVHSALEVDEILPRLQRVAGVLVALPDNLVEVTHRHLGHQRLLDGSAEDGLDTGIPAHLLTDVVHDRHDGILVPPLRVLDRLDLTAHDDDLASRDELAASVCGPEVLGNARRGDVAVKSLGHAVNHLGALASIEGGRWAGSKDKVAVQIDDKRVGWRSEESPALSGDTEDIWARLLDELGGMSSMHNRDVETAPLVDADAVADRLRGHSQHSGVVADEDDAAGRRQGGLYDAHDVWDGEAGEEGPHGEVLEAGGRGGELVAQGVVLHVDADEVVEARGGEAEDARDLLGVEEVGGLVPVDPHAAQVVAEQVVEGVSREEGQAVWDPVCLVGGVIKVGLGPLAEVPDGLGALLVSPRPDSERNTVEGVGGVLLQDERVVHAMRLASSSANLHIMREASLQR